jgi:putative SbcD/Mre11-related phosphoesterase
MDFKLFYKVKNMIKFLVDHPAVFITDKKILVISDIHIGIEHYMYQHGIVIPPQAEKFQKIIESLIDLTKAKTLVILGDMKYKVPGTSIRELKEIPKFLENLSDKIKIIITKGNHDDFLETLVPEEVKVYGSRGFKLGNYGFFHGHAWPSKKLMQCDYLFMGHLQPAFEFRDKLGYSSIQQVWLKGKLNQELIKKKYKISKTGKLNIIIVPSFNRLSGSLAVNKTLDEELTGPLLTNNILDISKTVAYLLDGTCLGRIIRT